MNDPETGKDKIKKICEILKNETLEPAQEEAEKIKAEANEEARRIIKEAEDRDRKMLEETKAKLQKELQIFEHSLQQILKQAVETLRQEIETRFFNDQLVSWVNQETTDPKLGAQLVKALVEAIERDGVSADFSALVPAKVPPEKVNAILTKEILEKLREKSVSVGDFGGGVQIKLHDRNLILDMSDEAIKELLARYIRKDFRERLFNLGSL